jgi:2-methylcitrate dehydratase PrpD
MNLTDCFVSYLVDFLSLPLTDEIRRQVKDSFIDYIGVTIAGSREENIKKLKINNSLEKGTCSILGTGITTTAHQAAFWNAVNAHVCELDDGHRYAQIHAGAPIFSALTAYAGLASISEEQFIKAAAAGYEAAIKTALAIQPIHSFKGYHATGTCGVIGSATAIAVIQNQTRQQLKSTLTAAMTGAGGLLEVVNDASEFKPYNAAHAAMNGLNAAIYGRMYYPPDDIFGGRLGFFKVMSGIVPSEKFLKSLCGAAEIMNIYRKPYAACRICHPAIECALLLNRRIGSDVSRIESIDVYVSKFAIHGHDHNEIRGICSAKMSTPYGVAAALCFGHVSIQSYSDDSINDPRIAAHLPRIRLIEKAELTNLNKEMMPAEVEIIMKNGEKITQRVDYPKGEPETPMTSLEIDKKMISLFEYAGIDGESAGNIINTVRADEMCLNKVIDLCK